MAQTYSENKMSGVRDVLETEILTWPETAAKKLFGLPSYFAGGTIFAVLETGQLALTRLNEAQRKSLADSYAVRPFQAGSRLVRKWAVVPLRDVTELDALLPYLEQSYRNALAETEP